MLKLLKFIQKRPSDKTIITIRIIFGLMLISILYYNFFLQTPPNKDEIESTILFGNVSTVGIEHFFKYGIVALGLFPLIFGVLGLFKIPVAPKKYVRIGQIILAIAIWYAAAIVKNQAHLDINEFLILAGFLPLFAGVTGKMITSFALKYGEKIKKIRV